MYMGRFPITNGVQRDYSWSQSKKFQHFTCRNVKRTSHLLVKLTVCFLANFSKTAERNKTLFTGIQVRLKLSLNQQTDRKSVHSTRRYFNIKVPYQMLKLTYFGSCFCTITNNHSFSLIITTCKMYMGTIPIIKRI